MNHTPLQKGLLKLGVGLLKLGVKGEVTYRTLPMQRVEVFVDGKYYGIWDLEKGTFVD
jgi:hypothetical protein